MTVLYLSYEDTTPEHTMKLHPGGSGVTTNAALAQFALEYAAATGHSLQASVLELRRENGTALAADALLPCGLPNGSDLFVTRSQAPAAPTGKSAAIYAKEGSAIAASQAKAGEHSYYYSVGKNRGVPSEAPPTALLPEPKAVAKVEPKLSEVTISSYSMIDDDGKIKVHIPLAGATALPAGAVTVDLRDRSFDLRVVSGNKLLRLHVPILLEEIKQRESFVKARQGKLVLTLIKRDAAKSWFELRKTKGVGDTEFSNIVPDSGESFIFTL
mmetsp:Transcript_12972/g.28043  ORF Transcript_12972/g.28043 Transcript_12972/m.28043 type:complete len:271 (-) Transcript_12972:133-945(-)